jgi:hypothetical protein
MQQLVEIVAAETRKCSQVDGGWEKHYFESVQRGFFMIFHWEIGKNRMGKIKFLIIITIINNYLISNKKAHGKWQCNLKFICNSVTNYIH